MAYGIERHNFKAVLQEKSDLQGYTVTQTWEYYTWSAHCGTLAPSASPDLDGETNSRSKVRQNLSLRLITAAI